MDHHAAIGTLTSATTTGELAAALATFTHLSEAGFPDDLPDGHYFDGFFFATMTGGHLLTTQMRHLPDRTTTLWAELDSEQLEQLQQAQLLAEAAADRRGRGRPQIGRPVAARLPEWRITVLDQDSEAAGVDRPELIRALIAIAYDTIARDAEAAGRDRQEQVRFVMRERAAR